jgi:hypothetical protein
MHRAALPEQPAKIATEPAVMLGRSAVRLWLYGLGMLLAVCYFARRYPLRGNSGGLMDLGQMAHYARPEFIRFVAGLTILFGFYVLALRESRRVATRDALPAVFGCGSLLAAGMAWMYPVNAVDVFLYAVRSRLLTTYGVNPMAALFRDYPHDPWMRFAHSQWAAVASPYGPLWNLIAAPITRFAGDRMTVALVGFKVLGILCLLAGGWAILRARIATSSASPATGALLYLWNPLVLWEGIGNAHNDIVMTLPLLLALLAWTKRRDALVIPLLVVATLIKYVPALLIPLAAVAVWRRAETWGQRWLTLGWSVALSLLVVDLALYPFYDFQAIRNSVAHQADIIRMSPAGVAFGILQRRYQGGDIRLWMRRVGNVLVLGSLAWQMLLLWRRPAWLTRAIFEIMYVFLLVATWYFNSWYLIWPVAVAALLPWGWPAWRIIAWSAGGLAYYGLITWVEAWWRPGFYPLQAAGVLVIFGATVLLTLAEIVSKLVTKGMDVDYSNQQAVPG